MLHPKNLFPRISAVLFSALISLSGTSCVTNTTTVTVPGETHTQNSSLTPLPGGDSFRIIVDQGLFTPANLTITAGDVVTWVNEDVIRHSVVSMHHFQDEDDVTHIFIGEVWDSGHIEPGQTYSREFSEAGVFEYIALPLTVRTPMEQYSAFSQVGVGVIDVR